MRGPVLVTGGTGTVGTALIRRLVADHVDVRATARSDEAARTAEGRGAPADRADVLDLGSLTEATAGCEIVFHVAGSSGLCLSRRDAEAMYRLNVEGTANVLRTAAATGVRRVVHTSSGATLGEARGDVGDERTAHRGTYLSRYERSKHRAELLAFDLGKRLGVEVIAVNPASVQGPGRVTGSARLLLDIVTGRLPFVVETDVSLVDVDDCAAGHMLAAERGQPGARYVLCGAAVAVSEAVDLIDRIWGLRRRPRRIPRAMLTTIGAIGSTARAVGIRMPFCHEAARTVAHGHRYDGSRATRELGLRYAPLEDTMLRTLAWYAERGFVPPSVRD